MNGRRPQAPDAVVRRMRASLADRAGDYRITPAFVERVQRLRQRRQLVLRAVQTTAVLAVVALAGAGIYESVRPPRRMDFVSPPPATASPTPEVPSQQPSPSPLAQPSTPAVDDAPSTPPRSQATEPDAGTESPAPDIGTDGSGGTDEGGTEPTATRVFLDGEPRPGAVCREDDSTIIATIELPEAETGYVIDLAEPVTMRIMSQGVTDVSDTVEIADDGDQTVYTASFASDNDDFLLSEVRVEGPTDPPAC